MNHKSNITFAYFGNSRFSVLMLDELERAGFMPACVVTTPDREKGRGLVLTPTPVKEWAVKRNIKVFTPEALDESFIAEIKKENCDVFIVVSYGKIMPAALIDLPPHKTLNVHVSLLPKYRGASPMQSAMLDDTKDTGVTIIELDPKMDHGPIVTAKPFSVKEWPTYNEFEDIMAREGGELLASTLPGWVSGEVKATEQDHRQATRAKKITKEDGLIDLNAADQYANFRKIQAFHEWPTAYFFADRAGKKIRVKIAAASFKGGKLTIEKVVPEGAREMDYNDFLKGLNR